jgi:hypothetical protein
MNRTREELAATDAELRAYRERGFFVRERAFAGHELEPLRDAVEEVERRVHKATVDEPGPVEVIEGHRYQRLLGSRVQWEWRAGSPDVRTLEPFHHLDPRLDRLVDDDRLRVPAAPLVGAEEAGLFTDKLNFKRPGGSPYPWHQDSTYWAFGCAHLERVVTVALYLDDATRENGCLWLVPGSHRAGILPPPRDRGVLGSLYTDPERVDSRGAVPIEAPAGSLLAFHAHLVHGSRMNRSERSRRALILAYQPAGLPRWQHADARPLPAR